MILATLRMRFTPHTQREPCAWYIASSDPSIWLDEVARWDVSHREIRLHPIPRSRSDIGSQGVLVVTSVGQGFQPSSRCVPYGCVAEQLFLPVEAAFDPDVSDSELGSFLSMGNVYVWHPTTGCVVFEPGDVLAIADLLEIAPSAQRSWNHAEPGIAVSKRMVSLLPSQELTLESVFEQGKDDIGTQQDNINELPHSPDEARKGIAGASSRSANRSLAGVIRWLAQHVPANSDRPTWINRLEDWAESCLSKISSSLEASRNKEISRLMHLLETDPDRGLRFALPMGGDAHRGIANPTSHLSERNVEFNLSGAGGGAADFWDIGNQYQYKLIARYRELANREIHLGRHRRAAYIFAELLGDPDAAANALVGGQHWREAATVYRKQLDRPLDAARCYEQGGLWIEAITLYEELKEFEMAGDLHAKLDQKDSAAGQYLKAVEQFRSRKDYISAARLLLSKLNDPDESLQTLRLGWPHSSQAAQCMREIFRMQGELGRHDASLELVSEFLGRAESISHDKMVVDILADQAAGYPNKVVQATAADCTRAVVSRQLSRVTKSEGRQLLAAVSRLAPGDRLLGRDCQRFLHQYPTKKPLLAARRTLRKQSPKLVRTITMPEGYEWKQATVCGKTIYAAGVRDRHLILVRCSWDGHVEPLKPWKLEPGLSAAPVILATAPQVDQQLLVHVVGDSALKSLRKFAACDRIPEEMGAGAIRGMSNGVVGASRTGHGATWLLEVRGGVFTLVSLGSRGEQTSTKTMPITDTSQEYANTPSVMPVPMHARGDTVYVGLMNSMLVENGSGELETIAFGQPIRSIVGSAPNTRERIAIAFEQGGKVYWRDFGSDYMESFASEMSNPVTCINRGGYLIAASRDACEIYGTQNRRVKFEAEIKNIGYHPITVLSAPRTDQFSLVSNEGVIAIYELA